MVCTCMQVCGALRTANTLDGPYCMAVFLKPEPREPKPKTPWVSAQVARSRRRRNGKPAASSNPINNILDLSRKRGHTQ